MSTRCRWPRVALLAACVTSSGCMRHGSTSDLAWHPASVGPPSVPEVEESTAFAVIVLGGAGAATPEARAVAQKLTQVVAAEQQAGRHPVILWLGNTGLPRARRRSPCPAPPLETPATSEGAALLRWSQEHPDVPQFFVGGPQEYHCPSSPVPGQQPSHSYVVRLLTGGEVEITSRCTRTHCTLPPPARPVVAELVMANWTPWIEDEQLGREELSRDRLDQLESLVEALEADATWPRLLVSHHPAEAAGYHGLGGGAPDAIFHVLPPVVARAIAGGAFAGMLAGHDHALYVERDLSDAIKRSDKVWLRRPFFQVVSGSSSTPVASPGNDRRRLLRVTSIAYAPDLYSPHEGFAVVRLGGASAEAVAWARVNASWQTATVPLELAPAEHPTETPSPNMAPCRDCREREHPDDF